MSEPSDSDLVLLARQGDKEAFSRLVERYQALMGRIVLRMVSAQDTAEDIVQEAMLQAYLSLASLQNPASFRSWLYGIILNLAKNHLRSQTRDMHLSGDLDDDRAGTGGDALDPQQIAMEREIHRLVLQAIASLPPAHRQAARLFYQDSLTLHEIAAITGASRSALKVRLHRARSALRASLQDVYPGPREPYLLKSRRTSMVKASVIDIINSDDKYVVILQDEAKTKILPIWIGPSEGAAIAVGLRAYPTPRPLTFDFIINLLGVLDAQLEEVRIEVLKDTIFYGIARLRTAGGFKELDARPSDVLALAVRTGSPIFVADEVMQQAGQASTDYQETFGQSTPGEGAAAIVKEFEEQVKRALAKKE